MGALLGAAGLQQWMGWRDIAAGAPASPSLNATGAQMVLAQDSFEGSDDARTYREGESGRGSRALSPVRRPDRCGGARDNLRAGLRRV